MAKDSRKHLDFSQGGSHVFSSFSRVQKHIIENKERLKGGDSFQMYFDEDEDALLDEMDGADELYKRRVWLMKNHKSLVFQYDINLKYITQSFEDVISSMKLITEDNGIYKKIIQEGSGNIVPGDAVVSIHYNAFLEYNDEPFDASVFGTKAYKRFFTYKMGTNTVFPGLEMATASMAYGEVAVFVFKPKYFYGPLGCPPKIPTDSSAMFFIELLDIKDDQRKKVYEQTEEEIQQLPFKEVHKAVEELNECGNKKFKKGLYSEAVERYEMGVTTMQCYYDPTPENRKLKNIVILKLITNMSLCYLKLERYRKAIRLCEYAIQMQEDSSISASDKLYYRYATALLLKGDIHGALEVTRKGQKLFPDNNAMWLLEERIMIRAERDEKSQRDIEKRMWKGILSLRPT